MLADRRLNIGSIERVLLVGGPSLTPYLRQFLADPKEGLGIPLEFGLDPLTVVARGAARFAGTQRREETTAPVASAGQFVMELDYKPAGTDQEPFVGGRLRGVEGTDLNGFTIEFINTEARTPWRSGKIPITPNGTFTASLWAEVGAPNSYRLELQDASGTVRDVSPDKISYTVGLDLENVPLIHSVGLALQNNEVRIFFDKGTELPTRKRFVQKLGHTVHKGASDEAIRLPVIEGEHKKADRNKLIGYLEIPATEIKRDLPAGAEIEITTEIDRSRLVRTEAFITLLNTEFEKLLVMSKTVPSPAELRDEVEREKQRLNDVREKLIVVGDQKTKPILERIEEERILEEVESSLDAASVDRDAADKAQNRLLDLRATVDELEESLKCPRCLLRLAS